VGGRQQARGRTESHEAESERDGFRSVKRDAALFRRQEPKNDGRNGGQMAERKKQVRAVVGTAKGRKSNKSELGTKSTASQQKLEKNVATGVDVLRDALGEQLQEKGRQIAAKLAERSELGDVQSIKLLMALAKRIHPATDKRRKAAKSTALKLGSEAEVKAEEQNSSTMSGREQKQQENKASA